jgi:hypothetical protein
MRHDEMNGAAARAMRIRRAHDMEATTLDTMHRRAEPDTTGVLARLVARLRGRARAETSTQLLRPEQLAAIESHER